MQATGNWYCAKCSRFVDNTLNYCETCGRMRGSARIRQGATPDSQLYWIKVQAAPKGVRSPASDPPAPVGKPTGLVPNLGATPPEDGRRSRP